MLPREIIYHVVIKYLDNDIIEQMRNQLGEKTYTDFRFIKLLEKHFDFARLLSHPQIPEDAWIYNYLYYETKKKEDQNPLKIGDEIIFRGRLPRRGLILKYYNEVILGKPTKKYFK